MLQTHIEQEGAREGGIRPPLRVLLAPSLRGRLLSEAVRPLRFALTGGLAGLFQLALLALLMGRGWPELPANVIAFLLAAQVNFALSSLFTWRDRQATAPVWRRWLMFHASIAAMAVVNQLVFLAARAVLPTLVAAAVGIAVAAVGNFLLGDRLVFRASWTGHGSFHGQGDERNHAA
jgi:putative flippase GtrA